ncbi:MAG TPA: menaquinone biosynthesis protein [Phnomibacter sp.]|nr:menaquinone biosynthesis protein [Phnomibacter sp.]
MEQRIRVGAVSYLNPKPLVFGLEKLPIRHQIDLSVNYPALVAQQLLDNEIDLGLVPVAILPQMKEYFIDSAYCIGALGAVGSVSIFSQVPLHEVQTLLLDYQSRTSVNLARILLKHYWQLTPTVLPANEGFLSQIGGTTAAVVIGDRAFATRALCAYEYDLAEAWKTFTGLPFVFAAWVANKPLPETFIEAFDEANGYGLQHLGEVIKDIASPHIDLKHYYTKNISYALDEAKRRGLQRYLQLLNQL